MKPERRVEKKFVDWCKTTGLKAIKLQALADAGFPDRTVILPNGISLYVEFKAENGRLRPAQKRWVLYLQQLHQIVLVTHQFSDAQRFVLNHMPGGSPSRFLDRLFGT